MMQRMRDEDEAAAKKLQEDEQARVKMENADAIVKRERRNSLTGHH